MAEPPKKPPALFTDIGWEEDDAHGEVNADEEAWSAVREEEQTSELRDPAEIMFSKPSGNVRRNLFATYHGQDGDDDGDANQAGALHSDPSSPLPINSSPLRNAQSSRPGAPVPSDLDSSFSLTNFPVVRPLFGSPNQQSQLSQRSTQRTRSGLDGDSSDDDEVLTAGHPSDSDSDAEMLTLAPTLSSLHGAQSAEETTRLTNMGRRTTTVVPKPASRVLLTMDSDSEPETEANPVAGEQGILGRDLIPAERTAPTLIGPGPDVGVSRNAAGNSIDRQAELYRTGTGATGSLSTQRLMSSDDDSDPELREEEQRRLLEKRLGKRRLEDSSTAFLQQHHARSGPQRSTAESPSQPHLSQLSHTPLDSLDEVLTYPGGESDQESPAPSAYPLRAKKTSRSSKETGPLVPSPTTTKTKPSAVSTVKDYRIVPDSAGVHLAVSSGGTRMYFAFGADVRRQAKISELVTSERSNPTSKGLLGVDIARLMSECEKEKELEAIGYNERAQVTTAEVMARNPEPKQDPGVSHDKAKHRHDLFVNKYSPRTYIDLVGDESINREVLIWVKEWEYCVFGKSSRSTAHQLSKTRKRTGDGGNEMANTDPLHRPSKRILMLSGPPGFGKTTLANVVATHCGYNVIEINASDDRTGDMLSRKLKGALESHSISGSRPNLIIIDEIDGASASGAGDQNFIKVLTDLVNSDSKAPADGDGSAADKGKKKKGTGLLRPIICICNDPYAPVLRNLRMIAHMVNFQKPAMKLLAKRIYDICRYEGIQTDLRASMALCEMTEGDIRSSLNTIQFIQKKFSVMNMDTLKTVDVGHKDMQRSLFRVWDDVFTITSASKRSSLGRRPDHDSAVRVDPKAEDLSNRFISRIFALVHASGEYDKVMMGCFHNYPRMNVFDTTSTLNSGAPSKIEQALDWMYFYDQVHRRVQHHQYDFAAYYPSVIATFHRLFSTTLPPAIEYPRRELENLQKTAGLQNISQSFLHSMSSGSRRRWTNEPMVIMELLPFLLRIVSPEMRQGNVQLLKAEEKAVLDRLVDIMIDFGLQFRQQKRSDEAAYSYRLDPPIDTFIQSFSNGSVGFDSIAAPKNILPWPYAIKQMIAQEIEKERLIRTELHTRERAGTAAPAVDERGITGGKRVVAGSSSAKFGSPTKSRAAHAPAGLKSPKLVPKKLDIESEAVARDFFGRPILVDQKKQEKENAAANADPKPQVTYKFNEGFSNAVRKPLLMSQLLG
ncbi:uncharacterized protein BJ171DRAFT_196839 [Polychytrium aggregatum]|uniref:uncharacterized protein n=1 Tax=Polychytrium aggregatum TaxID=110093 RepID=UPI0022FEA541|nr:uncharacterized protein BJ171DRAFT_196839 [Polychytrium aggregatum]KAI9201867.1 hypothetical protein BJ171DRAFT_196839 [Polychytrium aggregatum]